MTGFEGRPPARPPGIGRIADKAARMGESGAQWLRLIPYNHFFLLTHWAQPALAEKLNKLADEVRTSLAERLPSGVIVSSGAGLYAGDMTEETIREAGGIAMRRRTRPLRARETLIITIADASRDAIDVWEGLLDTEAGWLSWALDKFGLPDLGSDLPAGLTIVLCVGSTPAGLRA